MLAAKKLGAAQSIDSSINLFDFLAALDSDPKTFCRATGETLSRLGRELKLSLRAALGRQSDWDGQAPRVQRRGGAQ